MLQTATSDFHPIPETMMAPSKRRRPGRPRGEIRVQTKVRLTPDVHHALAARAVEESRSITAVLERAVLLYLDTEAPR
jgi:hypothetical protein